MSSPGTVTHQAPLSMEFSREEDWSGLLFSSPGDLPDPGIEPGSPTLLADFLLSEPPGKPEPHQNQDRRSLKITGLVRNVSPNFCVSNVTNHPRGLRRSKLGAPLVVQWLRICLPMQGMQVQSPVWKDSTCGRATKPMCHNY